MGCEVVLATQVLWLQCHAYNLMRVWLGQTLVPEAGDRSHNVCKDGVAPGESAALLPVLALLKVLEVLEYVPLMHVAGLVCPPMCGQASASSRHPFVHVAQEV